jgi:sugar phosphate isomerase/epimerase
VTSGHSRRPRLSVSQVTTLSSSFADDLRSYAEAGFDGIGIWESKLEPGLEQELLDALDRSGLGRAVAVPAVPSILPLPLLPGPADPAERVAAYRASIARLAPFRPAALLCLTGPAGDLEPAEARRIVVAALRELAPLAGQAGLKLALEPFQLEGIENWSIVNTISEAVELIAEVGVPGIGLQFDVWHLWNTPDLFDEIAREAARFLGVHVSDWRSPTRSFADRVLPGDGVAGVAAILDALDRAGWDGYYDIEIFSDDGAFGNAYPDSLWAVPPAVLLPRARNAFDDVWKAVAAA